MAQLGHGAMSVFESAFGTKAENIYP